MKNKKDQLPFEQILTAYLSGKGQKLMDSNEETEATFIFQQPTAIEMSEIKIATMLDALAIELNKESLGVLVDEALTRQQLVDAELQEKTGLTPSLLDAIKKDLVFTNSIPVRSLAKLLKLLGLEIDKAMNAIKVTFDKLQIEGQMMNLPISNFQPSYRKGMMRGELNKDLTGIKADESFLYQNEEALANYTDRLTELYHTI